MAKTTEKVAHPELVGAGQTEMHSHAGGGGGLPANLPGLDYGLIKGGTQNRRYAFGACSTLALGTAGVGAAANSLRVFPFIPPMNITADRLCCWVSTLLAGNNVKLAIYGDNGSLYPGALLASGEIDTSATGLKDLTISLAMEAGKLYWGGYVLNTITTLAFRKLAVGAYVPIFGLSAAATPVWGIGWAVAHTYANALPNPYPAGATITATLDILVAIRAS